MKLAAIAWTSYSRRTTLLAHHLGATPHFIQYGPSGNMLLAPARYPVQIFQTWRILLRERPDVVLVQNPPIFCVLVAALYARRYGARYIIDSHTGAFVAGRWHWSVGLHRQLSKTALTTLVHNTAQEGVIQHWDCPYLVLAYTPGDTSDRVPYPLDEAFNVVVVSSFRSDERPEIVFEAAGRLPDVTFYVTGNPQRLSRQVLSRKPANCHLTGYLPYDQYAGLLSGADAVMALTTRDETLLMGGFEAVSAGIPFITSSWPVLMDYFSLGTVHIPYTAEGICHGVRLAQVKNDTLQRDMLALRELLDEEWHHKLAELKALLRDERNT